MFKRIGFLASLITSVCFAQEYKWDNVKMGGGGFVSAVLAHPSEPNLFYARTDVGGAYRWNESTSSWVPLLDGLSAAETSQLGVDALAMNPRNPDKLFLLAGTSYWNGGKTAILRSSDRGNTWQYTDLTSQFKTNGNGMGRQNGERLVVDPNQGKILFVGTRANGLFRSLDEGVTWSSVSSFPVKTTDNANGVSFVLFNPNSATLNNATQHIFAGISRSGTTNIYESKNGGISWSAVAGQPTGLMPQRAILSKSGQLLITYADGQGPNNLSKGAIFKYDLNAKNWSDITPILSNGSKPPFSGISVAGDNDKHLIAGSLNIYWSQPFGWGDRIFESFDGGITWTDLMQNKKVAMSENGIGWIKNHALHWMGTLTFDPNNSNRVFATSGNGVFMTSNLSAPVSMWNFQAHGIEETVPGDLVSLAGGPMVSVILDYDGFRHDDIYSYPSAKHSPPMGSTTGLAAASANIAKVARVSGDLYVSSDTARTWSKWNKPTLDKGGKLAFSTDGNTLLWTPPNSNLVYRTDNSGATWTNTSGLTGQPNPIADGVNSQKFYSYNRATGEFFMSQDKGKSFSVQSKISQWGIEKISSVYGFEGHVLVPLNNGGLLLSLDQGKSFEKLPGISVCTAVGIGKAKTPGAYPTIFIWGKPSIGETGIYRSTDKGQSWIRVNDNEHQYGGMANGQFVKGDMNVFGRVYMSSAGRGIIVGEDLDSRNAELQIEAEEACGHNAMIKNQFTNFSGKGYLDFSQTKVADANWSVSSLGQKATFQIRYSNGLNKNLSMNLFRNGKRIFGGLQFPSTGSWDNWKTISLEVNLTNGRNILALRANQSNESILIDLVGFRDTGVESSWCNDWNPLSNPSQSSVSYGGEAIRAIDGDTSGLWNQNSITHTSSEKNPWWYIDLGAERNVKNIKIYNRKDCCTYRLNGAKIFMSNEPFITTNPQATEEFTNVKTFNTQIWSGVENQEIAINQSTRYIRIQIPGENKILSLAEVVIEVDESTIANTMIRNHYNDEVLEVPNGSKSYGANIQTAPLVSKIYQSWTIFAADTDAYTIKNSNSGQVLDVAGKKLDDNANVGQWGYSGSTNQKWKMYALADNATEIRAVHSGLCLSLAQEASSNVVQKNCNRNPLQLWEISSFPLLISENPGSSFRSSKSGIEFSQEQEAINIQLSTPEIAELSIYDLNGKRLVFKVLNNLNNRIPLMNLESGNYLIKVKSGGETISRYFTVLD